MVKFYDELYDELSTYVRHCAWLNAVPDAPEGNKKARRESLKEPIQMPQVGAEHVVMYLFEIGPTLGETSVSHAEIEAWQRNTGIELDAWETRFVKRLSAEYLAESHNARKHTAPAPWADGPHSKMIAAANLADAVHRMTEL